MTNADNSFSGKNHFNDSVTVPSNTTTIPRPTTVAHPCTDNTASAVNVCDLLAVFDSLTNKMNDILKTIDTLKHVNDSLAQEIASLKPALTVTGPSSAFYCGGSNTLTFTASVKNANAEDYNYTWTVNGSAQSSTTATMSYTPDVTGDLEVNCAATRAGSATLQGSTTVHVSEGGTLPKFGLCQEGRTVTVKIAENDLETTVVWGDGEESVVTTAGLTHEYSSVGTYTIIASSTVYGNCKLSWPVTLTESTIRPCTGTPHTGNNYNSSGLETVKDGKIVSVKDQDGHTYSVTQIGDQCWMRTNLRVTTFNDGTPIPTITPSQNFYSLEEPRHFINDSYNDSIYGYFYNWAAAAHRSNNKLDLCPKGWRVPTQTDLESLVSTVGASFSTNLSTETEQTRNDDGTWAVYLAGGCSWNLSNSHTGMTPSSYENQDRDKWGFTAIPAGRYAKVNSNSMPDFLDDGVGVYFWSSTEENDTYAKCLYLGNGYNGVSNEALDKGIGRLVRCVRDDESSLTQPTVTTDGATNVGSNVATLNGTITNPDNVTIDAKGFEWGATGDDSYTQVSVNGETMSINLSNLDPEVNYTYRAYIIVGTEIIYGDPVNFTTSDGSTCTPPSFIMCENFLDLEIKSLSNVDYINWDDGSANESPSSTPATHQYQQSGIYTIILGNNDGCSVAKKMALGNATLKPCTISSKKDNEGGTSTAIDSVRDQDNNWYGVVQIGSQCWMKSNLRTTSGINNGEGSNLSSTVPYYYRNDNNPDYNEIGYGLLYNWPAVMKGESSSDANPSGVQGICPIGWHVPSQGELVMLYSNYNNEYSGAFTSGCSWNSSDSPDSPGDYTSDYRNFSGFGLLPTGCYTNNGYENFGDTALLWGTTNYMEGFAMGCEFFYDDYQAYSAFLNKRYGYAVRCVRNPEPKMSLSASPSDNVVTLCSGESVVTYTANIQNDNPTFYNYTWEIPEELVSYSQVNGNTCAVTYNTAGSYIIGCTASFGEVQLADNISVTVGGQPSFTICDDDLTVSVLSMSNVCSIKWCDDCDPQNVTETNPSHTYSHSGVYSITAYDYDGTQSFTKQVALGNATLHPCTVNEKQEHEGGSLTSIDSVRDWDNIWYGVVEIGSRCWMKSNLRSTHYFDGVAIASRDQSTTSSWYVLPYDNDKVSTYGLLYSLPAATRNAQSTNNKPSGVQGVCPEGWHIPSKGEWEDLLDYVSANYGDGENGFAGTLAGGCDDWNVEECDGASLPGNYCKTNRNITGFSALPVGYWWYNNYSVYYISNHQYSNIWSCTFVDDDNCWSFQMYEGTTEGYLDYQMDNDDDGLSVRCVRDW